MTRHDTEPTATGALASIRYLPFEFVFPVAVRIHLRDPAVRERTTTFRATDVVSLPFTMTNWPGTATEGDTLGALAASALDDRTL